MNGNRREDAAILYRSNAQSRVLEAALLQADIPYRIYGGQRFYERLEIKNALAYLRLMLTAMTMLPLNEWSIYRAGHWRSHLRIMRELSP